MSGRPIAIPPSGYVRINGNVQFITIGGLRRFVLNNDKTSLNSSVNLGMAILDATDPGTSYNNSSSVMFAGGLKLGLTITFQTK